MGLNCSKPKPEVSTLKDLMEKNNFIHGKLHKSGECQSTMDPYYDIFHSDLSHKDYEHPDCLNISPNLDIIELDACTINRALKTAEPPESKDIPLEGSVKRTSTSMPLRSQICALDNFLRKL